MTTYTIEAPNGKTYDIEGPEGVSKEQVLQVLILKIPEAGIPPAKVMKAVTSTNAAIDTKADSEFYIPMITAVASSFIGVAITWAIVRYVLPQRYAQSRKVDRSANVLYIAGWMLSIAIGVNIGNMANEIIFSGVMGHELNQNNIHKSLIGVVIWPLLIYAIGYVIAKTISALGKPSRAGVIRTAAAPDASAKGLAEQITQLNELYKQGALSKEQFEAAKVKLLG